MDAPPEGMVVTESSNGIEEEKSGCVCQSMPANMDSALRRQFLQDMVKGLPVSVQDRIASLKNLQREQLNIENEFDEEVYKLERRFHLKYQPLFDKRREIVEGTMDPVTEKKPENTIDAKGIPGFWLTVFRTVPILSEMVQPQDEPALRKLTDISIKYVEGHSYILEFHFGKNEYFSNPVLTKMYVLKSSEGSERYKCTGCTINWEHSMNLTMRTSRKRQRHRECGAERTIVRQYPTDSFFHFFNPPKGPTDESQQTLETDFLIGHLLRAKIIPKAVLYYTGDLVYKAEDEDEDEEEDDEEEEQFDENQDDELDKDDAPPTMGQNPPAEGGQKQLPNQCPSQ